MVCPTRPISRVNIYHYIPASSVFTRSSAGSIAFRWHHLGYLKTRGASLSDTPSVAGQQGGGGADWLIDQQISASPAYMVWGHNAAPETQTIARGRLWEGQHSPGMVPTGCWIHQYTGADPGGGRWGARPPLGLSFTIQNALFNSIQAPVHHWAPTPGRSPASAPEYTRSTFSTVTLLTARGLCFGNGHRSVAQDDYNM